MALGWTAILVSAAAAAGGPGDLPALEPLVAEVARFAVAVHVEREPESPRRRPRRPGGPRVPQDVEDYYRRPAGPATGLLLDAAGDVLTSFYNVSGTLKSIEIVLPGGARRPARLLAKDESDDLALLRITDPPPEISVPELKWAGPERLRVGRWVIAVGRAPDPERPTATVGIVSAVGRNGGRAFQTDAELNYGNVGGPIVDLDGAILGLAAFVGHTYDTWGLNSGIGFGTSAETIGAVLPRLQKGEDVPPPELPFLGVGPAEGMSPMGTGVSIGTVQEGSAAAQAGLKPGDSILAFDGRKVEDFVDIRREINRRKPGDEVVLKVRRGSEDIDLKAVLGKRR